MMEENIKTMERKMESHTKKQESQNKHIEEVVAKMNNQEQGINTRSLNFMPKLEFPKVDGSNSRI